MPSAERQRAITKVRNPHVYLVPIHRLISSTSPVEWGVIQQDVGYMNEKNLIDADWAIDVVMMCLSGVPIKRQTGPWEEKTRPDVPLNPTRV